MSLKKFSVFILGLSIFLTCSLLTMFNSQAWYHNNKEWLITRPVYHAGKWRSQEDHVFLRSARVPGVSVAEHREDTTDDIKQTRENGSSKNYLIVRPVSVSHTMDTINSVKSKNLYVEHESTSKRTPSSTSIHKNTKEESYQYVINSNNGSGTTREKRTHKVKETLKYHHSTPSKSNGAGKCTPEICLSRKDLSIRYDHWMHADCFSKALLYLQKSLNSISVKLGKCSCTLLRGEIKNHRRVALVSLPGSGNTWVRGLLECATNICTGSMWCDPNLRATQFCGEGLHSAKTLAIKIHDSTIRWRGQVLPRDPDISEYNKPEFDAAIFVHRNPFDSIVADHNRALGLLQWEETVKNGDNLSNSFHSHHVDHYGKEYFGENVEWNKTVYSLIQKWEEMVDHLLIKSLNRPVFLVQYENLKSNSFREVVRMLKFLHYEFSEDVLRLRLQQEFSTFHRNHSFSTSFEHFTSVQKEHINSIIIRMASKLLGDQPIPLNSFIQS